MNSKDFICDSQSREDIRRFSMAIRRKYGYENILYFPIEKLFDEMSLDFNFDYEILDDSEFKKNFFANASLNENKIYLRKSIYEKAVEGDGFGRMTLAHELGHILLFKLFGIKLYRKKDSKYETYEDPEWQAKCFGGELLMHYEMTKYMSVQKIIKKCGVTNSAAMYRVLKY